MRAAATDGSHAAAADMIHTADSYTVLWQEEACNSGGRIGIKQADVWADDILRQRRMRFTWADGCAVLRRAEPCNNGGWTGVRRADVCSCGGCSFRQHWIRFMQADDSVAEQLLTSN